MHGDTVTGSSDEAAIRDLYRQMMEAWNQNSGAAFAAVFAEDGDLVGFDGTHFKGGEEIAATHGCFRTWFGGCFV
jgi:uncharacterized protein (TIGR02246 family)